MNQQDFETYRAEYNGQFKSQRPQYLARLGHPDGTISIPNQPNYIWVRLYSNSQVMKVLNFVAPLRYDLPVIVGYTDANPQNIQVIEIFTQAAADGLSTEYSFLKNHASTHQWSGGDTLWVDQRQLQIGLPRATTGGGFNLQVDEFWYPNLSGCATHFSASSTGSAPFAACVPTAVDTARYILTAVDVATGSLSYTAGPLFNWPNPNPGAYFAPLPANVIPLGDVLLQYGDTGLTQADIDGRRRMFLDSTTQNTIPTFTPGAVIFAGSDGALSEEWGNLHFNYGGRGLSVAGSTSGSVSWSGILGKGYVSSSSDSAFAIGVYGIANQTHAGGWNMGVYGQASGGSKNYAFLGSGNMYLSGAFESGCASVTLGGYVLEALTSGCFAMGAGDISASSTNDFSIPNHTHALIGGGSALPAVPAVAFVETTGNDTSASVGRYDLPFATIDAALDALPAGGGVVKIGVGTFAPVTGDASGSGSKLKDNVAFIGSGKPSYAADYSSLENGTIIQGPLVCDRPGMQFHNLGVDAGSDVCTALYGGVAQEALSVCVNIGQVSYLTKPARKGIIVNNVATLGVAGAAIHNCLVENVDGAYVHNLDTACGYFGLVLKAIHTIVSDVHTRTHNAASVIIKSNTYAECYDISLSNIQMECVTAHDSIGLQIDPVGNPVTDVMIANLDTKSCYRGVILGGSMARVYMWGVVLYDNNGAAVYKSAGTYTDIYINGAVTTQAASYPPLTTNDFDATAPTTISAGDSATAGSSLAPAHRDHTHGAPATYPADAHAIDGAKHTGTLGTARITADAVTQTSQVTSTSQFTTTSTSFVDVDASLSITLTTTGGPVLVWTQGVLGNSTAGANYGCLDLAVDGTRQGDTDGLAEVVYYSSVITTGFNIIVPGLSAGSHAFKPQLKAKTGGTAYYGIAGSKIVFGAIELKR